MGRSVSTHSQSVQTVFLHGITFPSDFDAPGVEPSYYEFDEFIEDLRGVLTEVFPSLTEADRWEGRETHIIAENRRAEVAVSEYMGVIAVDLAPVADPDGYGPTEFNRAWAQRVAKTFCEHLEKRFASHAMRSIGHFSNGERVFAPVGTDSLDDKQGQQNLPSSMQHHA